MEVFLVGMPRPYKCMVSVHAEIDVPRVAVEELLWNAQPMCYVDKPVVPLGD